MSVNSAALEIIFVVDEIESHIFMNGLKKAGIDMNRKVLSEIAIADPAAFAKLVEAAKAARN